MKGERSTTQSNNSRKNEPLTKKETNSKKTTVGGVVSPMEKLRLEDKVKACFVTGEQLVLVADRFLCSSPIDSLTAYGK